MQLSLLFLCAVQLTIPNAYNSSLKIKGAVQTGSA